MISGLLQDDVTNTVQGVPFLKDIPILGALFRSSEFLRDETELVVTVAAYTWSANFPTYMLIVTDVVESSRSGAGGNSRLPESFSPVFPSDFTLPFPRGFGAEPLQEEPKWQKVYHADHGFEPFRRTRGGTSDGIHQRRLPCLAGFS